MKFLYADSLDFVDPRYDFIRDRNGVGRKPHADDQFPHEHLVTAPYDGLLISRGIVGSAKRPGKYSETQCIRFSREGARSFLRYETAKFPNSMIMGDCGAFSYRHLAKPPFTCSDMLEFYVDSGFTHGCSVDHVIFAMGDDGSKPCPESRDRYDITLDNASSFFKEAKNIKGFQPLGVVQGWSPRSMARAAAKLCSIGYKYLAIGGMVPLKIGQIARILSAIREQIPSAVKLHALGFGKFEHMDVLRFYDVHSFDTTSPLYRAFKDQTKNYFAIGVNGELEYYTAVRIPQAVDNDDLVRNARRGRLDSDRLLKLEADALESVREFGANRSSDIEAVNAVLAYGKYALWDERASEGSNEKRLEKLRLAYLRTLRDRAWERCGCRVCIELGVEVMLFRSSNRNKRRGIHNLHAFHSSLNSYSAAR